MSPLRLKNLFKTGSVFRLDLFFLGLSSYSTGVCVTSQHWWRIFKVIQCFAQLCRAGEKSLNTQQLNSTRSRERYTFWIVKGSSGELRQLSPQDFTHKRLKLLFVPSTVHTSLSLLMDFHLSVFVFSSDYLISRFTAEVPHYDMI